WDLVLEIWCFVLRSRQSLTTRLRVATMPPLMAETTQIIYSMRGVTKTHEKKVILKDITLSYYYGAKIGVLGLNGAGKSTLLKIMAGVDKNYEGQGVLAPGYTVGYLQQEPQLDNDMTVRQVVEQGASRILDLLK